MATPYLTLLTTKPLQGTVVGVPIWKADGALSSTPAEEQLCDSKTITVPLSLGPFDDTRCGAFEITHLASVQPLGAAAPAMTVATPLQVTISGCASGKGTAGPTITPLAPKPAVRESYSWAAALTHDGANPLIVQQSQPVKVSFVADIKRSAANRWLDLEGTVLLEAPGSSNLEIAAASVGCCGGLSRG